MSEKWEQILAWALRFPRYLKRKRWMRRKRLRHTPDVKLLAEIPAAALYCKPIDWPATRLQATNAKRMPER
jgi:hypothetical protein